MAASMAQIFSRRFLQISLSRRPATKLIFLQRGHYLQRNIAVWYCRGFSSISDNNANGSVVENSFQTEGESLDDSEAKNKSLALQETKLLKVAIIGEPNSGKSTLMNRLVGEKIAAVTEKPHTTRQMAAGVITRENVQIVLLDTPGIVSQSEGRRLKITREHVKAPDDALYSADIIAVLCDASNKRTRDRVHEELLHALEKHMKTPSFLILNKIDNLRHKVDLLVLAAELSEDREKDEWGYANTGGWSKFDNVFMVSARMGDGVQDLMEYLTVRAKPADWLYPPDTTTDLELEKRVAEIIREKMLQLYEHEIPWQVKQVSVLCDVREGNQLRIHQKLYCRKKSQRRCVLEKLDALVLQVQKELESVFGCTVNLSIDVGVSAKVDFDVPLPNY